MHFGDDEKPARKSALHNLMSVLSSQTGKKLSGLKKSGSSGPAAGAGGNLGVSDGFPGETEGDPEAGEGAMHCEKCGHKMR